MFSRHFLSTVIAGASLFIGVSSALADQTSEDVVRKFLGLEIPGATGNMSSEGQTVTVSGLKVAIPKNGTQEWVSAGKIVFENVAVTGSEASIGALIATGVAMTAPDSTVQIGTLSAKAVGTRNLGKTPLTTDRIGDLVLSDVIYRQAAGHLLKVQSYRTSYSVGTEGDLTGRIDVDGLAFGTLLDNAGTASTQSGRISLVLAGNQKTGDLRVSDIGISLPTMAEVTGSVELTGVDLTGRTLDLGQVLTVGRIRSARLTYRDAGVVAQFLKILPASSRDTELRAALLQLAPLLGGKAGQLTDFVVAYTGNLAPLTIEANPVQPVSISELIGGFKNATDTLSGLRAKLSLDGSQVVVDASAGH
ncbi:hypothetical protein FS320_02340 [Microvirga tunisiensis]|uniref:Uncharacterized protein n=1 Tax=Microvirga tunisiensis TaxID=2108360 RepID=A0A5N7MAY8_9HYPH|nr:hypothetical protein [Microvirga tunisiensis]MPR24091.1 hypothetical protein [Microvirga tunisiensis]